MPEGVPHHRPSLGPMQTPPEPVKTAYALARERLEITKHNKTIELCNRTGMAYENARQQIERERMTARYY